MIAPLPVLTALAHGGAEHVHEAPAPPPLSSGAERHVLRGQEVEGLLVVDSQGPPRILLADRWTSAPVELRAGVLDLVGPEAEVREVTGLPALTGHHRAGAGPLRVGEWAGTLRGQVGEQAQLVAVPAFEVGAAGAQEAEAAAVPWVWIGPALALAFVVGLVAGGFRKVALATFGLLAIATGAEVSAHGEDGHLHEGDRSPPPSADSGIVLPLEQQFLAGLRTERARPESIQPATLALGTTIAARGSEGDLRSPVAGVVERQSVRRSPGEAVKEGEVILKIRPASGPEWPLARSQWYRDRAAEKAEAEAALAQAERALAAAEVLGPALSPAERKGREAEVARARAVLDAELATEGAASGTVDVVSPSDGLLAEVLVGDGAWVEAGQSVARIDRGGVVLAEVAVPLSTWSAGGPSGGRARVGQGPFWPIRRVGGGFEAAPTRGVIPIRVELEGAPPSALALPVEAWLDSGPAVTGVAVADSALSLGYGPAFVFVKIDAERFERRELRLGDRAGSRWAVVAGLQADERVVVAGVGVLRGLAGL